MYWLYKSWLSYARKMRAGKEGERFGPKLRSDDSDSGPSILSGGELRRPRVPTIPPPLFGEGELFRSASVSKRFGDFHRYSHEIVYACAASLLEFAKMTEAKSPVTDGSTSSPAAVGQRRRPAGSETKAIRSRHPIGSSLPR